jgi:type VI secretion system secreted protein VgrG
MDTSVLEFSANVTSLEVGTAVSLQPAANSVASDLVLDVSGDYMVVRLHVSWRVEDLSSSAVVQAIPLATPVRLRQITPEPKIAGLEVARVCGAPGDEIHPDALGRVRLWFPWDIGGTTDHTSSLPVRVTQPNMPGSMNIPRVDWEEFVAFEEGDPDRPYAIGRGYTALHAPPFALPKNKQVTALRSHSSPGSGGMNSIHMDDAAGAQHLLMSAQSALNVKVGADAVVSTEKKERETAASQTRQVGGNQKVSVKEIFIANAGSQSLSVAAKHSVYTGGNLAVSVGGELVGVGGALLEKIGNPADGAAALGKAALLAAPGVAGGLVGGLGGMAIGIGGGLAGVAYGAYQAHEKGQSVGAALVSGAVDMAGGMVPGGSAVLGGVKKAFGDRYPWDPPPPPDGPAAAGGGAGAAAGGGGGPTGPGPGYKNEHVKGAYSEIIGAALAVVTPGKISWETQGGQIFNVGASHTIRGLMATKNVGGSSTDVASAFHVKAGSKVHRQVNGAITTNISGGYTITSSGGKVSFDAGAALTFKASSMDLQGGKVTFEAGGSIVAFSSDGLLIKAADIEINGDTHVDGGVAH